MHDASISTTRLRSLDDLDLDAPVVINTPVHTWVTAARAQVRFVEARGVPMVDVILRFRAGSVQDHPHSGLAALTLYTLDEGSAGLSALEHAERIEHLGAVTDKRVRLDYVQLSLRSLSAGHILEPAIALFVDLVARPDFPAPALEKIKQQLLALQTNRERQPTYRVISEVYRHLFQGHPYGTPEGSTAEGIAAIQSEDLQAFHRKAYSASNLEMVLVGDLSREQAQAIAEQISQALPTGWAATDIPALPAPRPGRIHIEHPGASHLMLLTIPIDVPAHDPAYPALQLASAVLGQGTQSRLMQALRQDRGLTYDISTRLIPLQAGGLFVVQWDAAADQVEATHALVLQTLRRFMEQGPTADELRLARQQLAGSLVREVAQNRRLATLLAEQAQRDQPADHINTWLGQLSAFDPRQVQELCVSILNLNLHVLASVGPASDQ